MVEDSVVEGSLLRCKSIVHIRDQDWRVLREAAVSSWYAVGSVALRAVWVANGVHHRCKYRQFMIGNGVHDGGVVDVLL
jgi:hypothetical protein